jgi:hypothetical protein
VVTSQRVRPGCQRRAEKRLARGQNWAKQAAEVMKQLRHATLLVALLFGCASEPEGSSASTQARATAAPTARASASAGAVAPGAAASTSAAPADTGPPVCSRANPKAWGSGANKLTGLTTKKIGEAIAVGFAVGLEPRVLVIDKAGSIRLLEVKLGAKTKPPSGKEGTRDLMRVTPRSIDGEQARAFVDYHDDLKDKRRRVWCGPAESADDFLSFEGTSWLDLDPKPTGEDKKKLFSSKKKGGYVELRDCRTFVTRQTDEVWALGSVLRGIEKPDGSNEWTMVLLVDFGKGDEEIVLHEAPLKGDPPKLATFEIPTSRRAGDKGYLIATRFGGSLLVGVLDASRKRQGSFKSYPGYPTMPDIGSAKDDLVLTTGVGYGSDKTLKALVVPRDTLALPSRYLEIGVKPLDQSGDAETSFTTPELTFDGKEQRWLTYVEGPKDKGKLRIVPLGKDLQPSGRAFSVTEGDALASEGRLVALDDGRMVVAYLREQGGKVELVTAELACEVKK